ncbi:MAG: hypothetical protein KDD48_02560 [Bdellovibrionales bacterium]|nr:hypothetical protein [Bdellovibrionales bacterium]
MTYLIEDIQQRIPKDVFRDEEIELLQPDASNASRRNKLSREVSKGNLMRLMRGVYVLAKKHQRFGVHPFEVAQHLSFPSYISLESALSYYHLIPEGVQTTTSVTLTRSKTISTPVGIYSFSRLPLHLFREGFFQKNDGQHKFLIANPLKAILDYVYIKKKEYRTLQDLEGDLRLDLPTLRSLLRTFGNKEIHGYIDIFKRNNRIKKVVEIILWNLL